MFNYTSYGVPLISLGREFPDLIVFYALPFLSVVSLHSPWLNFVSLVWLLSSLL